MPESARHLIDIDQLSDSDIERMLNRACALASGSDGHRLQREVANLFLEPSTRTRVSFELAARRLGLTAVNVDGQYSSVTKGESLVDTVATLGAMGIECVVLRHPESGSCQRLVQALGPGIHLVNAGEAVSGHPSQALLDAAALKRRGADFARLRIAIIGDLRHSRVAASGIKLWQRLGVEEIRLAGPPELMTRGQPGARIHHCSSLSEAVEDADIVMMLRIQRERMDSGGWLDEGSYFEEWGLKPRHLRLARPDCLVMHPGPINRGIEIDPEVADGDQSMILEQVRMGVFMRMAIFEWLFGEK